jgi:heme/copper-type cytochrome/quinol oxidase subunit 3
MLRTVFFVLSLLTDYEWVPWAAHAATILGAVNTGILLTSGICAYARPIFSREAKRTRRLRATKNWEVLRTIKTVY